MATEPVLNFKKTGSNLRQRVGRRAQMEVEPVPGFGEPVLGLSFEETRRAEPVLAL